MVVCVRAQTSNVADLPSFVGVDQRFPGLLRLTQQF
jgi:hypothetical protein